MGEGNRTVRKTPYKQRLIELNSIKKNDMNKKSSNASPEIDVSIIIVSYNVRDYLRNCLKSIYQNTTGITYEIFVVDNASSDGSADMVAQEFPKVKLIKNDKNLRFAGGNNIAIRKCDSRYILLLNSDTFVLKGAIGKMFAFMEGHPNAAAVGPMLLSSDSRVQYSARSHFPSLKNTLLFSYISSRIIFRLKLFSNLNVRDPYSGNDFLDDKTKETQWVGGSCIMVKKKVIDKIGLLDERLFLFSEDTDLCYRMRKAGWKIYFLDDAKIIHYEGQSSDLIDHVYFYRIQSTCQFFEIHYGKLYALCYRMLLPIDSLLGLLITFLHGISHPKGNIKKRLTNSWLAFKWSMILLKSTELIPIKTGMLNCDWK